MIREAVFTGSFTDLSQCPEEGLPEYAFIGRSNVGKSSLVNLLTGRKALAKVSNTPGKTKTLNYFLIDNTWNLVDLPGYGFAKVSKTDRKAWDSMIKGYLTGRKSLACVFVLIDIRIPPQKLDIEFINWLGEHGIPCALIFTKCDKLKAGAMSSSVAAVLRELKKQWSELPPHLLSSSVSKRGKDDILNFINDINLRITEEQTFD